MKCPNCGEEMVEGECGAEGGVWARPVEHNFWGRPSTTANRMKVCYHCGLMLMFVQNPALFRPKTGTETLPRPAGVPEPSKETLPRPANDEVNET